jgi:copper(I)-binding protein
VNKSMLSVVTAAVLLTIGTACGSSSKSTSSTNGVSVKSPWMFSTPSVATRAAVYMAIENSGTSGDALTSASVSPSVAKTAELHETTATPGSTTPMGGMGSTTTMGSGMTTTTMMGSETTPTTMASGPLLDLQEMNKVDSISLAAGKTTMLEPGGFHVMLMDLVKPLEKGQKVSVTLVFRSGGTTTVDAEVRDSAP